MPDINASCVVIGFGVNVLACSMRIFVLLVLNWLILIFKQSMVTEMVSFLPKESYRVTF